MISKVKHSESLAQFHPIFLCNVIIKVVSKVLANRLQPLMTKLIGPSHAGFIPGRLASDSIIIAQDIVDSFQKKKGYMGAMIVKVDLDKAYDRVNWTFL